MLSSPKIITPSSFTTTVPAEELTPTAILLAIKKDKTQIPCRAIIDTGSTANFITETLSNQLQLIKSPCSIPIGALNGLNTFVKAYITVTIGSRCNGFRKTLNFLIIPNISSRTSQHQIEREPLKIPPNLPLADPEFHKPAPIDMLLGTGIALSLLSIGQIKLSHSENGDLLLQKTVLGWIIAGSIPFKQPQIICHLNTPQIDFSRFWEIEELPNIKHYSPDEQACEQHFAKNITRTSDGRYVVALPFNKKIDQLGTSRLRALRRFFALENRLNKDQNLKNQYHEVIEEYFTLNHMEPAPDSEEGFYLPHHAIIKTSSMTTKLRVVFDGSATSSTGISLNETLFVGPTIQSDLFSILLKFRLHNYVITGDIEKMYRQVLVRPQDRDYQRIIWRDKNGQISTYRLKTVTFGLGPAPFLAVRCINQLTRDEGDSFPRARSTLNSDLYVDDFLSGASTIEDTISLRDEVIDLLKRGGFNMRQFASNAPEVLKGLPEASVNLKLQISDDSTLKTLGIYWDSQNDTITYSVQPIKNPASVTKRFILSEIAKIFDPLGLVSPVIVCAKLLT